MSEVEDMIKALDAGMTNITGINGKLREENEQLKNRIEFFKDLLSDDLYDSKDWRDADTAERVEYLIELVAYKDREIDLWLEQIEFLNKIQDNLIAAFRVNVMQSTPHYTHEAFDELVAQIKDRK